MHLILLEECLNADARSRLIDLLSVQYPEENVAGFASYLLNQWRSLLSSSVCPQDKACPAAASAGFSAAASASPDMAQANLSTALLGHASAPAAHGRQQPSGSRLALPMPTFMPLAEEPEQPGEDTLLLRM